MIKFSDPFFAILVDRYQIDPTMQISKNVIADLMFKKLNCWVVNAIMIIFSGYPEVTSWPVKNTSIFFHSRCQIKHRGANYAPAGERGWNRRRYVYGVWHQEWFCTWGNTNNFHYGNLIPYKNVSVLHIINNCNQNYVHPFVFFLFRQVSSNLVRLLRE